MPELMRKSDILVLPSIEEGFGLVIAEAMGSGCVPLASEACTEICSHMKTGLMHKVGDVEALTQHITMLHEDRALLERLRAASLEACPELHLDGGRSKAPRCIPRNDRSLQAGTSKEAFLSQHPVCVGS